MRILLPISILAASGVALDMGASRNDQKVPVEVRSLEKIRGSNRKANPKDGLTILSKVVVRGCDSTRFGRFIVDGDAAPG